jgi:hypothetical protein
LPGWPADNFAFLYKFWWFRTALFETHQWPFFDPNSFAPFGFNLGQGEPTLANTLPGALLGGVTGDIVAYNLMALSSFVVSGLGAYVLVKETSGSRAGALLGGVAFAFCPYRMSQLAGHIQLLGTGWIAFAFYFLERALRTGRWHYGALAGISFALAALSAWYYAYMVGLMLALYIAVRLWSIRRALDYRRLLSPALAFAGTFALLAGPVALPSLALWGEGRLTHSAKAADEHSAAPLDYIIPNELHPVWGEPFMRLHSEQNVIESSLYLGAVVAGIALLGLVSRRGPRATEESRPVLPWVVLLVVSAVLSLGLTLHGLDGQVRIGGNENGFAIPLPGQLLYDWLPFFSSMRAYARFGIIAMLALVVLMAYGWSYIAQRWTNRANWLTLLALVLVLVDFLAAPYSWGTSRVFPTNVARYLAEVPPGIVIHMPLTSALNGPALFAATNYGKPVAYGYDTFEPGPWREQRPALVRFPEDAALDVLRSWGVRYVVVSANAYGADWQGTSEFLRSLPRLRHIADFQEARAWEVDPAVVDARPDMEEYLAPDTFSLFELVR